MSTQLDQIAKKARSDPKVRFTSLAHLLTPEFLKETWRQMNRRGASGIDGETTKEFERELDTRVKHSCLCRTSPGSSIHSCGVGSRTTGATPHRPCTPCSGTSIRCWWPG